MSLNQNITKGENMNEEYTFENKNGRVIITFVLDFPVTYCTISVVEPDRKVTHYHDGVVYNLSDHYNPRTGKFLAFKKALRKRFENRHGSYYESVWKGYHERYAHLLAAFMDGKVIEGEYDPYKF